jgi:6-pyruvoyltetrahydropterin/6-carboxytetrahydropterin synthase
VDFGELKKDVADIIAQLDHKFLNESDMFNDTHPPSSENIARHIAHTLQDALKEPGVNVSRVTAWESENAGATYILNEAEQV